jgi:hypothetical protein
MASKEERVLCEMEKACQEVKAHVKDTMADLSSAVKTHMRTIDEMVAKIEQTNDPTGILKNLVESVKQHQAEIRATIGEADEDDWLLFGDGQWRAWCWRCIEDWEDDDGKEHKGKKVKAICEKCCVCANCEHDDECQLKQAVASSASSESSSPQDPR